MGVRKREEEGQTGNDRGDRGRNKGMGHRGHENSEHLN
jgi:hypothetical protein